MRGSCCTLANKHVRSADICIGLTRVHRCNASHPNMRHSSTLASDLKDCRLTNFTFGVITFELYTPTGTETKKHEKEATKLRKTKLHNTTCDYESSQHSISITIITLPTSPDVLVSDCVNSDCITITSTTKVSL